MTVEIGWNQKIPSLVFTTITHQLDFVYHSLHEIHRTDAADRILFSVQQEVEEQGHTNPSDYVQQAARTLLLEITEIFTGDVDAGPTGDGEIMIEAVVPHVDGASVLFLCGPEDCVICVVYMNGHYSKEMFFGVTYVKNQFIRNALFRLQSAFLQQMFPELNTKSPEWHDSYYQLTIKSNDQPVYTSGAQIVQ